jgi:superfamily II DNA helicase RecQ
MVRAGVLEIEVAEYEKDGEVRRFRKVRITERGLDVREATPLDLLLSDGVVEEFSVEAKPSRKNSGAGKASRKNDAADAPVELSAEGEALAARLKEWRTAEAKKLGIPAYMVLHDRALRSLAAVRPQNPKQLLEINGMGPTKAERFGGEILEICGSD